MEQWHWLGGRPAMDFANTLRGHWRGGEETLRNAGDLRDWLVAAGLLPAPMPVRRPVLADARELRAAIDAVVLSLVEGRPAAAPDVARIDGWLVHAGARPRLALDDGLPVLGERPAADSPRRALGTIALDAAALLGTPEQRERVRVCEGDECSVRFYDRSPAGGRRWCSMSRCGNVAKGRRHRDRRRSASRA